MSHAPAARAFEVRHVQLGRALFAAIAALMVTFSTDHSAVLGLSVFSGFAIATGLVLLLGAWLAYPTGRRALPVVLGLVSLIAGMIGGLPPLRTTTMFFVLVISWALLTGLIEGIAGWRALRRSAKSSVARAEARDVLTVGIAGVVLGLGTLVVPARYALNYYIEEAGQSFTLTGIAIAVGLFGAYGAIVAVYLGIAAFSPRREDADAVPAPIEDGRS
ncbi:MAG: acyl-CoA synthetase [Microbacterium sp.]|uniref:acyl-CoA synthetase n=1 Tax=Microbacterium sp. TaxID=51671 RepID=UPI00260ECD01|nr:acyl-CoA synthetase [Microbacterium sp.]MCX6502951.1 acyl-CoA synthetase [Microbacterium sp.]